MAETTKKQRVLRVANFKEVLDLANRGNPAAQSEVQRELDAHPEIWRSLGDLAGHAEQSFVRMIAPDNFLFAESVRRRAAEMRKELAGAFPTPLELLAAQRLVAAWMYLQHVEVRCAQAEGDLPAAKFWLVRQQQAHRVYHAAVKSLLLVRELLPAAAPPAPHRSGRLLAGANGERRPL